MPNREIGSCEDRDAQTGIRGEAMKILKQGKLSKDEVYQGRCNSCGTEVEFLRAEARYVNDQRDGDSLVVVCPMCKNEIWTSVRGRNDR